MWRQWFNTSSMLLVGKRQSKMKACEIHLITSRRRGQAGGKSNRMLQRSMCALLAIGGRLGRKSPKSLYARRPPSNRTKSPTTLHMHRPRPADAHFLSFLIQASVATSRLSASMAAKQSSSVWNLASWEAHRRSHPRLELACKPLSDPAMAHTLACEQPPNNQWVNALHNEHTPTTQAQIARARPLVTRCSSGVGRRRCVPPLMHTKKPTKAPPMA